MADPVLKDKIKEILKKEFPDDTVDVSDGFQDNVHVIVVSRKFDDMSSTDMIDYIWTLIDRSDLPEAQKKLVSMILPVSPADLK